MSQSASSSSAPSPAAPYVCDTIPPARLALQLSSSRSPSPLLVSTPPVTAFQAPIIDENALKMRIVQENNQEQPQQPAFDPFPVQPPRKLCVRHQRMADEGTNLKLQQVGTPSISTHFSPGYYFQLLAPPLVPLPRIFVARTISGTSHLQRGYHCRHLFAHSSSELLSRIPYNVVGFI